MTWTRWKVLAGALGLSIGGLAATCQEPNTRKCHNPPEPVRQAVSLAPVLAPLPAATAVQTTLAPPLPVPAPTPVEAPKVAPVELKPAPVPSPSLPDLPPVVVAAPKVEPIVVAETPPVVPVKPDLPKLDLTKADPKPIELPKPIDAPKPEPKSFDLPKLDLAPPAVAVEPAPPKVEAPTKPDPLLTVKPDVAMPSAKVPARPTAAPPADLPPSDPPPVASLSSNVRVTLRLGDGRPTFDVLQGDDCLLKAVSDRVEVKAPGDKTDPMTPLKAAGAVRFSAPGCEGTCDALTVLPGTGEVELVGSVRVRCKQGKGETEVSGGTMRFKLGTAPGYTVTAPDSGTIHTSFTPVDGRK